MSETKTTLDAALHDNAKLRAALKPFADYAPRGLATVPGDLVITNGSSLAKRQLTMGDCYKAREAVDAKFVGLVQFVREEDLPQEKI